MTLDEAIKEFTDWGKDNRKEQNFWAAERDENDETNPLSYADCEGLARDAETRAEYHEQLAEWLTELKQLKAIIAGYGDVNMQKLEMVLDMIRIGSEDAWAKIEREKELKEAKRLLKAAVEDIHKKCSCECSHYKDRDCDICVNEITCDYDSRFQWVHEAEALKLIGDESSGV